MGRVHLFMLALYLTLGCEDEGGESANPVDGGALDESTPDGPAATDADAESPPADASMDAPPPPPEPTLVTRAPCFEGAPIDTALEPLPSDCLDLYGRRPDLESGCYVLDDGLGAPTSGYCWRKRALVLLVNNEIETPVHPDDTDGDGVLDQGEFAGINFPPDPFVDPPAGVGARMRREIRDYFAEISYGALALEANDVYWVPGADSAPDRWFRLQRERPGFANRDLFREVCLRRGGMTGADWRGFDFIVTIVSYGTAISGSQGREEDLPVGPDCAETETIWRNYLVVKNFRGWYRLGTYFHELGHGLSRDPNREPSVGHSEAVHVVTGENAAYGDLTDLMGESSDRGHLSLPQKLFLRFLPPSSVDVVDPEASPFVGRVHALESRTLERKGLRVPVSEGMAYYVEARRNKGSDVRLPAVFKTGVLIKRARKIGSANKSYIVDPTPETPSTRSTDSVLFAQRTFADRENEVYISVLASDSAGAEVAVRRGPPAVAPPGEVQVEMTPIDGGTRFTATAQPGDPTIDAADLLYFWKLGARDAPYQGGDHSPGPQRDIGDGRMDDPLWLVVSDQRGGETWTRVLPRE